MVVPPDLRATFEPLAKDLASSVKMTDEQKAQAAERSAKLQTDPEFLAQVMGFAEKAFAEADANNDGLLSEEEFVNFVSAMKASAAERGDFVPDYTKEQLAAAYKAINTIEPAKEGLALEEILMARFIINVLVQELAAAAAGQQSK